jgi:hypothetical protein
MKGSGISENSITEQKYKNQRSSALTLRNPLSSPTSGIS